MSQFASRIVVPACLGKREVSRPAGEQSERWRRTVRHGWLEARGMLRPMSREFAVEFTVGGCEDALFRVSSRGHRSIRAITVMAGERRTETWSVPSDGYYHLVVRGPQGLTREYRGSVDETGGQLFEAQLIFDVGVEAWPGVRIANFGALSGRVNIKDLDSRDETQVVIDGDEVFEWRARRHSNRYNYCVTSVDQPQLRWHFAGATAAETARRECALAG